MALTKATLIDLNSNELILDLDADTSITADTDDTIHFKIAGADEIVMTATAFTPAVADGSALGSTSLEWSDLFLADGAVINFGADQDINITHVADTGLTTNADFTVGDDLFVSGGLIDLKNTGTVSTIKFYCESSNAHAQSLVSAPHSEAASNTLTLPGTGGDARLVSTTSTATLTNKTLTAPTLTGTTVAASLDISGDIDVDGTTNLDVVDIDGAVDMATLLHLSVDADADDLTGDSATGRLTIGAGQDLNLYHGGTNSYIVNDTGDLIIDSAVEIQLDADGGDIILKDNGTEFGRLSNSSTDFVVKSAVSDKDLIFKGNDGGSEITALTLDMSAAGAATFASTINSGAITSTGIVTGTGFTAGNAVLAEAELELLDGLTAGTAIASKVVTTDANIDTTGQRNLTISGELDAATLDISGNADIDGTTNLDVVDIDGAVDMASTLQVDGAITSSDGATITTADNTDTLSLVSTDADANQGPNLRLYRNSGSPADNDILGMIDFEGRNDNSQDYIAAQIETLTSDVSDGTEDAYMNFSVMLAGTLRSRIEMDSSETVINEASQDLDFRVESDAGTHALFVDGGNNVVIVGGIDGSGTTPVPTNAAGGLDPVFQLQGANNANQYSMHISAGINSAGSPPRLVMSKSRDNTLNGNTILQADDAIGAITFAGADGTDRNSVAAEIIANVDGTPGGNDMPGRLSFLTTADGSNSTTERVRIHNNGVASFNNGIALGVGTANTASNVLDDYEEGNWTPELESNTGDNIDNYDSRVGRYVKVGRQVRCSCYIDGGTKGTVGGSVMRIGSLPFAPDNDVGYQAGTVGYWNNLDIDDRQLMLAVYGDNDFAYLFKTTTDGGGVQVTPSDILDDSRISATIFYETDS